tara:strand:- start:368 stop:841 length:474 start_codon:yes stop_codon:yes gene_type:complete
MKIVLLTIGKTKKSFLSEGIKKYLLKIKHYTNLESIEIDNVKFSKNISESELINKEAELLISKLAPSDYVILLDEKGRQYSSLEFSKKLNNWMIGSKKRLVFIIGGAYGVSKTVSSRVDEILSFSSMTFSHQMIRLFFLEQLYRAYTILNNNPYHHE